MPAVSIIVPVFKVEEYLSRCIESIIAQTYTDFELLLIDDGSPDNCGQICDRFAETDGRIRVFHKKNEGVSSARNIGLENALGKYVTFVDSDDIVHPKYLELLIDNIEDSDVISCQFVKLSSSFTGFQDIDSNIREKHTDMLEAKRAMTPFCAVWGRLYVSSLAKSICFDKDLKSAEDALYLYNYYGLCNSAVFIEVPLYCYCLRETSAVSRIDEKGLRDRAWVSNIIYESELLLYRDNQDKRVKSHLSLLAVNAFYSYKYCEDQAGYTRYKKIVRKSLPLILSPFFKRLDHREKMILLYNLFLSKNSRKKGE